MEYTQPTKIDTITPKFTKANKPYIAFVTTDEQWFNVFEPGAIISVNDFKNQNANVVIGYEMNGQYTDFKNLHMVSTDIASVTPETRQNAPVSGDSRQNSIERQCAMKCAVELICAGKISSNDPALTIKILIEDAADAILAWIKNETPVADLRAKMAGVTETIDPEEPIHVTNAPF